MTTTRPALPKAFFMLVEGNYKKIKGEGEKKGKKEEKRKGRRERKKREKKKEDVNLRTTNYFLHTK